MQAREAMPPTPGDHHLMPNPDRMFTGETQGELKVTVALIPKASAAHIKGISGTWSPGFKSDRSYFAKQGKGRKVAISTTAMDSLSFISEVLKLLKRRCSPHSGSTMATLLTCLRPRYS